MTPAAWLFLTLALLAGAIAGWLAARLRQLRHAASEANLRLSAAQAEVSGQREQLCTAQTAAAAAAAAVVAAEEEAATRRATLARLRGELEVQTDSLRRQKQEARDGLHDKSRLLAAMTHELKSPLVSMSGYLELLKRGQSGELNEGQLKLLGVAQRNLDALHTLISQLIDYSQLEMKDVHLDAEPIALGGVVAGLVRREQSKAAAAGVQIEYVPPGGGELQVNADLRLLSLAVGQLIENSLKFSPQNGRIEISLEAADGMARLRVQDHGAGIPREMQTRIFDGFFQVDRRLSRAAGGLGLGLAIARRVALLHGGDLTVESEPGEGSAFILRLPLATTGATP